MPAYVVSQLTIHVREAFERSSEIIDIFEQAKKRKVGILAPGSAP